MAAWWLTRYQEAGVRAPEEMVLEAQGRRSADLTPVHLGWSTDDDHDPEEDQE